MSACFGVGMVAGPVAGDCWAPSPCMHHSLRRRCSTASTYYWAASQCRSRIRESVDRCPLRAFNPVSSFRWARGMTIVAALMTVFFIMQLVGQVPAALWVIFGEDRFRWSATMIGLSLAVFGILHALAQAFVTGPATKRFGEKQAIIAGMAADALGYVLLAFATRGWMAFPIMILLASGGIGMPALQAMLSRQVDDDHQGQLQGSLAALTSLTSIIGPLIVTAIYAASASTWNGLAWIVGAALYLVCLPALRRGAWSRATST